MRNEVLKMSDSIRFCQNMNNRKLNEIIMSRFTQSEEQRRDELIRLIESSVEKLTLPELEALYYDMTTKAYIES